MKIILGSQSQGRQDILREMGYEFEVMPANIDEKAIRMNDPKELVLALGNAKADVLVAKITEPVLLITGDQVVAWKGEIREKPEDEEEARGFLRTYYQAPVEPTSSIVVTNTKTGKRVSGVDIARVYFKEFSEEAIDEIIDANDIFHRAGGFSIEDPLFDPYIRKIEGTVDSVKGFPKKLAQKLIQEVQE